MAGTVVDRGNNHYELRISLGYVDGKQRRATKRITATSKRAAQKELDKFYLEVIKSPEKSQIDGKLTFKEFIEIWEERHNKKLALTTSSANRKLLKNRIEDIFSGIPLKKITPEMIMKFVYELQQTKNEKNHDQYLSATTVFKHFNLLNLMFNKAVEWKLLAENPCQRIPRSNWPKPEYHRFPIWQEKDLEKFLSIIESLPLNSRNIKHKTMFYIALLTGARKGELGAITWNDIKWDEKAVHVTKSAKYIDSKHVEISKPKTEKSIRNVYVDDYTLALLRQHKIYQDAYLEKNQYENPHGFVFLATRRRNDELVPVTPSCLYLWLNKLSAENNLPHITVHSLRHMAATYALNRGAALTTVQAMLGHTNIRTTSIYLHTLDSQRKETAAVLSEHLQKLRHQKKDVN